MPVPAQQLAGRCAGIDLDEFRVPGAGRWPYARPSSVLPAELAMWAVCQITTPEPRRDGGPAPKRRTPSVRPCRSVGPTFRVSEADRRVDELVGEQVGRRESAGKPIRRSRMVSITSLNPGLVDVADRRVGTVAVQPEFELRLHREVGQLGRIRPERVVLPRRPRRSARSSWPGRRSSRRSPAARSGRTARGTGRSVSRSSGRMPSVCEYTGKPASLRSLEGQVAAVLLELVLVEPRLGRSEALLGDVAFGDEPAGVPSYDGST